MPTAPMLVFDAECAFCNRGVQFILKHEQRSDLLFVPRSSPFGLSLREQYGFQQVESMLWIERGRAFAEFEAVAHAAEYVGGFCARLATVGRWFPRVLLNFAYRVIARIRKRISRAPTQCMVLTPAQRERFRETPPVPYPPSNVIPFRRSSGTVQS